MLTTGNLIYPLLVDIKSEITAFYELRQLSCLSFCPFIYTNPSFFYFKNKESFLKEFFIRRIQHNHIRNNVMFTGRMVMGL